MMHSPVGWHIVESSVVVVVVSVMSACLPACLQSSLQPHPPPPPPPRISLALLSLLLVVVAAGAYAAACFCVALFYPSIIIPLLTCRSWLPRSLSSFLFILSLPAVHLPVTWFVALFLRGRYIPTPYPAFSLDCVRPVVPSFFAYWY